MCFDGKGWRNSSKLFPYSEQGIDQSLKRTGWVMPFSSCYHRVHSMFLPSGRIVLSVQLLFARNTQQIPERKDVSVRATELEEKTL